MNMIGRLLSSIRRNGIANTFRKLVHKIQTKLGLRIGAYTKKELNRQRVVRFPQQIKFSILVPLYNTPEQFLREMIESVQNQTYGNWELCLADGSDEAHTNVGEICMQYAAVDARVCYRKLEKNLGISGNTNACIEMSTGDYIALFDHDDLLHPAALYEMMAAVCEQNADFLYTDEDSFFVTPADAYSPHYKPDYALDTLRSYNYICHFTAFSRELLEQAGSFRSEFDGSQDYGLILRLPEKAEHIVHIAKILYYWRNHAASTASNVTAKPYTMVSGKKALAEHLDRTGLQGTVSDSSVPTTYRVAYEIHGTPLISIVISGDTGLERCISSVREKTTYSNYEIITDGMPQGNYMVLLDSDTEIITPDWLEQMLMFAQRKDVGAVGAMLWYPDDTVEHAGLIIGADGTVLKAHHHFPRGNDGYKFRMTLAQNYSAVSSACMMVRRELWERLDGMDASMGCFADVDFCLRLRKEGHLTVWTPYAELYHHTTGQTSSDQKAKQRFTERWKGYEDPYYNRNLTVKSEDFSVK